MARPATERPYTNHLEDVPKYPRVLRSSHLHGVPCAQTEYANDSITPASDGHDDCSAVMLWLYVDGPEAERV